MNFKEIPASEIIADPADNTSRHELNRMNPQDCQDLAQSIEQHGLLQPLIVRKEGDKYRLTAGFRRYVACHIILGWETLPCVVSQCENPDEVNYIENLLRKDLTLWEQIVGLRQVYPDDTSMSEIQRRLGLGKTWVNVRWKAWLLPDEVKQQIEAGIIPFSDLVILVQKGVDVLEAAKQLEQARNEGKTRNERLKQIVDRRNVIGKKDIQRIMTVCMEKGRMEAVQALRVACGEIVEKTLYNWFDKNPIS